VLLMDEPFGAVDPVRRGALQREFKRLQRELKKTVVFVTHDVDEAVLLGDRIAIMREGGEVAQFGPPDALLAQPSDDFVASFIGDTRGLKLLSLRSASEVPATKLGEGGLDGWILRTDGDGRPVTWCPASGDGRETPVESVGPKGSMRDLIDSAVASPARAAVRVDDDGKLVGAVPFSTLTEYLPAPQEIAAESQGAR
jgi:osmoprotectant transport system ATP-binding protein